MLHVPDGTVNVCSFNGRKQFYFYENGKRSYINERNRQLVHKLCQKDYDQRVLRSAQKELKLLEKLHLLYHKSGKGEICDSVYEQLGEERQKEVQPILLPDSEFIKQWENVTYEGKGYGKDAPEFYT